MTFFPSSERRCLVLSLTSTPSSPLSSLLFFLIIESSKQLMKNPRACGIKTGYFFPPVNRWSAAASCLPRGHYSTECWFTRGSVCMCARVARVHVCVCKSLDVNSLFLTINCTHGTRGSYMLIYTLYWSSNSHLNTVKITFEKHFRKPFPILKFSRRSALWSLRPLACSGRSWASGCCVFLHGLLTELFTKSLSRCVL